MICIVSSYSEKVTIAHPGLYTLTPHIEHLLIKFQIIFSKTNTPERIPVARIHCTSTIILEQVTNTINHPIFLTRFVYTNSAILVVLILNPAQ